MNKKNGGLIKTSDATSQNINKMALVRLVKKGLINRLEKGLYIDAKK
ncbi:MAG: type IV toxin-antitoxin system AbiEi family antitoxin domain-containing protein [Clostridia bacterium]|nr:type IV toxin-antitoxin system AbiEi family antitoxin domain-containing protein [Clostridia bacterium]